MVGGSIPYGPKSLFLPSRYPKHGSGKCFEVSRALGLGPEWSKRVSEGGPGTMVWVWSGGLGFDSLWDRVTFFALRRPGIGVCIVF